MKREQLVIGTSVAVFLLIPFVSSDWLCRGLDSLLGRLVLLGTLLYSISLGTTPAIFTFLAIAALFAERNRLRIYRAQEYIVAHGSHPPDKPFRSTPEPILKESVEGGLSPVAATAALYDTTHLDILAPAEHPLTDEKEVLAVLGSGGETQTDFFSVRDLLPASQPQNQE